MRRRTVLARWLIRIPTLLYGTLPVLADLSDSHALHPEWPGHARLHVVWLIGLTTSLAAFATYLTWTDDSLRLERTRIAASIGLCVTGSFWVAGLTRSFYGGLFGDPNIDPGPLGFPPNLIVFAAEFVSLAIGAHLLRGGGPHD